MLLLLIFIPLVLGTQCNPLIDQCIVNNKGLNNEIFQSMNIESDYFEKTSFEQNLDYGIEGLKLTMNKRFDNPTLTSKFYILYGKVEAEIKAAKGLGIVSSFYLQSDDLDEIDIVEMFGGDPFEFQTNFFIKGNTTSYDRGGYHPLTAQENPLELFNRYAVEWTSDSIKWWVNDKLVRHLDKSNIYGIPNSPMAVKLSLWAGGDESNEEGTILWAGGKTDYSQLPCEMMVKNLYVNDYSKGNTYRYGNHNGQWLDILPDLVLSRYNKMKGRDLIESSDTDSHSSDEIIDDSDFVQFSNTTKTLNNGSNPLVTLSLYVVLELVIVVIWF